MQLLKSHEIEYMKKVDNAYIMDDQLDWTIDIGYVSDKSDTAAGIALFLSESKALEVQKQFLVEPRIAHTIEENNRDLHFLGWN